MANPQLRKQTVYIETIRVAQLVKLVRKTAGIQNGVDALCTRSDQAAKKAGIKANNAALESVRVFDLAIDNAKNATRRLKAPSGSTSPNKSAPVEDVLIIGACASVLFTSLRTLGFIERDLMKAMLVARPEVAANVRSASKSLDAALSELESSLGKVSDFISKSFDGMQDKQKSRKVARSTQQPVSTQKVVTVNKSTGPNLASVTKLEKPAAKTTPPNNGDNTMKVSI